MTTLRKETLFAGETAILAYSNNMLSFFDRHVFPEPLLNFVRYSPEVPQESSDRKIDKVVELVTLGQWFGFAARRSCIRLQHLQLDNCGCVVHSPS
jgi:hypothetical protein